MLPKVSILICAYNNEKYIHRCLDSVKKQTYDNFEVVILDDHSKDRTYSIAKKYAQKDKRFRVLRNPKNLGICRSRNIIISQAKGEYFYFLDSDDWVGKNLIKNFIKATKGKEYDMCQVQSRIVFEKHPWFKPKFIFVTSFSRKTTNIQYTMGNLTMAWGVFVNTSFWRKLNISFEFGANKMFEDMAAMPYAYLKADRFLPIKKVCHYYYRRRHSTSTLTDNTTKGLIEMVRAADYFLSLCKKQHMINNPKYAKAIQAILYMPAGYLLCYKKPKDKQKVLALKKAQYEFVYVVKKKYGIEKIKSGKSWWKKIVRYMLNISFHKYIKNIDVAELKKIDQISF